MIKYHNIIEEYIFDMGCLNFLGKSTELLADRSLMVPFLRNKDSESAKNHLTDRSKKSILLLTNQNFDVFGIH